MRLDVFTERAQEAIVEAQEQAQKRKHSQIEPEHLLLALLEQREGVVPRIVRQLEGQPAALASQVEEAFKVDLRDGRLVFQRKGVLERIKV